MRGHAAVNRSQRVVQQDDLCVGVGRPCERNASTLPARQRHATFSDDGCISLGELQQVGSERACIQDSMVTRLVEGLAEEDVIAHGAA